MFPTKTSSTIQFQIVILALGFVASNMAHTISRLTLDEVSVQIMMSTFDSYFSELAGDLTRDAQEGVYPIFQNSNHTDTSQMVALDAYFALPSVMAADKTAYATYKEQIKERNEMGIAQVEAVYVAKESKLTDLQKALYQALKVICRNKNLTIKELEDVLRATKGKYSKIDNYEIDRIVVGTFYPYAIEIMDRHSN